MNSAILLQWWYADSGCTPLSPLPDFAADPFCQSRSSPAHSLFPVPLSVTVEESQEAGDPAVNRESGPPMLFAT